MGSLRRAARPMTRRASTVLLDDADFLVIDFYLVDDGPGVSAQEWRIVSQDIHSHHVNEFAIFSCVIRTSGRPAKRLSTKR
jgi:hypothetical protein